MTEGSEEHITRQPSARIKQVSAVTSWSHKHLKSSPSVFLPGQVSELGVNGTANDLAANTAEFLHPVAESNDLGGTHEREVQGVEEEDQILPWREQKHDISSWRSGGLLPDGCLREAFATRGD